MRKRVIISLVLIFMQVFSITFSPGTFADANETSVKITSDGEIVNEIQLEKSEKKKLLASYNSGADNDYQWQLLLNVDKNHSEWINIYDKTDKECDISYALVKNLLDESNSTYIRAKITTKDGEVFSDPISITVIEKTTLLKKKNLEVKENYKLLEEGYVEEVNNGAVYKLNELDSDDAIVGDSKVIANNDGNEVDRENNDVVTDNDAAKTNAEDTDFEIITEEETSTNLLSEIMPLNDETIEYVTITVKYLDSSSLTTGQEAAIYSPYVATIEKGSLFVQNVISPTFLGFAPFYDKNEDGIIEEDASVIKLDYENVNENIVINVYYKPTKVPFAVRYFFQNLNDDLYTEDASRYHKDTAETGSIISDEYLIEHAGDTTGFELLFHYPESVAANGSTVFECYYDRNYYLISFILDGGYGVEPLYARYDSPYIVNNPIKHGYVFEGWDLLDENGNGDGIPDKVVSKIPAKNMKYKALWSTTDTKYTVVYWLKNSAEQGYDYIGSRSVDARSSTLVSGENDIAQNSNLCGKEAHTHSEENGCYKGCEGTVHTHDITCYATSTNYSLASSQTGTVATVFSSLKSKVGNNINEAYVYKYAYRSGIRTTYYNFFYINDTWYYLGTGTTYCGISLASSLSNPSRNNYNSAPATECTAGHIHTDSCLSCKIPVHNHTSECQIDISKFVFERADQDILVKGDGSTVVNVYYKTKEYTLKFYYAKEVDGKYYVAGDSTAFAYETSDSIKAKLDRASWGQMKTLPTLNDNGLSKGYKTGTETYDGETFYYLEFTTSYNANIGDIWPIDIFDRIQTYSTFDFGDYAYFSAWNVEHHTNYSLQNSNKTLKGKYLKLDDMLLYGDDYEDVDTISFLAFWENGVTGLGWNKPHEWTYNIYLPVVGNETSDKTYNGVDYKLYDTFKLYDNNTNSNPNEQTATAIEGYTNIARDAYYDRQIDANSNAYIIDFYYSASNHNLQFTNYGNLDVTYKNIAYNTPLKNYFYEPEYPDNLEDNAYIFDGWYTTPECYDGTKIDWDINTMPDNDLMLYAKWKPLVHEVKFFLSYDDMLLYEKQKANGEPITVTTHKTYSNIEHGAVVGSVSTPNKEDENLVLVFSGWFYIVNGEKKAFSPLDMPINKDLNIFADWSSNQPQPYKLEYVLQGTNTKVADDVTGFAYGGSTRTFTAKVGSPYNQLYDEYNEGYFPTVSSHSITMQYEEDVENPTHNVYSFEYVKAIDIKYTVRYINKETNAVMDEKVLYTNNGVVTERFKAYENMVPDAFYKRLFLSVEYDKTSGEWVGTKDNVINFYYSPNETSAFYAVHFMMEKEGATEDEKQDFSIDGSGGYEESGTHMEGIGDIGSSISITPQSFSGYELMENSSFSVIDGKKENVPYKNGEYSMKISENGSELYIFYSRKHYSFKVNYYIYNTTTPVDEENYPTEIGSEVFGSTIERTAPEIPGYTCVSDAVQSMPIREKEEQNVINFYYSPAQYVAEYVVVPEDGGWLTNTIEVCTGNDAFKGSIPTTNPHYEFVGWFIDEECTISAEDYGTINNLTSEFIPDKEKLSKTNRNIFYAKFNCLTSVLTIERTNAKDPSQVFVYSIKDELTGAVIKTTIVGNGSVTIYNLPQGEYTVTQENDWSWRYGDNEVVVNLENTLYKSITFDGNIINNLWLKANSVLFKNIRGDN